MKIPGGGAAIVDLRKLTNYCLDPNHPRGKHKARVFASVGFTAQNAEALRDALLRAVVTNEAQQSSADQFGTGYVVEFQVVGRVASASSEALGSCAVARRRRG